MVTRPSPQDRHLTQNGQSHLRVALPVLRNVSPWKGGARCSSLADDASVTHRIQRLFLAWLVLAVAVMITVGLLPGLEVDWSPGVYMAIAAVFALVNLFLGPVLRLLSLPVMLATLGLFAFVINTALFLLTDWLMDSLHVETVWPRWEARSSSRWCGQASCSWSTGATDGATLST